MININSLGCRSLPRFLEGLSIYFFGEEKLPQKQRTSFLGFSKIETLGSQDQQLYDELELGCLI